MSKINVVQGNATSLVDGVIRKNIDNMSFYYLDDLLLLQTKFDLNDLKHEVIVKAQFLTNQEKDVLDRLLIRLNLKLPEKFQYKLYGSEGWVLN